jgi:hypothetical protein
MNRLAILVAVALAGGALALSLVGCGSGPYTGKPERLKKPRAKKRPEGSKTASEVAEEATEMSDEQCRTNFFAEPHRGRRQAPEAKRMANRANGTLVAAERQFGPARQELVVEAMAALSSALRKDPYGPEATYQLAVAYALVGKKACSLALLERLSSLTQLPAVEKDASLVIQRAVRDPAFKPFERDARKALGE